MKSVCARVVGVIGIVLLIGLGTAMRGAEQWVKVSAPQFTLYSSGKSAEAFRVAAEFEQFIGALGEIIHVNPRNLAPLTIILFDHQREFKPFRPRRPDGKPWEVAGFFSRQEDWAVFGLAGTELDEEVRRTVLHEGVHWYLSAFEYPNPPWMEEGLAEVFSTFQVHQKQRAWGQPINSHVQVLRSERPLPLERLLAVSRSDPLFNETNRTGLFYAESWAFVHYLLFGENSRTRNLFNDFMKANRSGEHPDTVFKTVFGNDYAAMDRQLANYLRNGKYFVSGRPLAPAVVALNVGPATDLEREIALARLALGSQQFEVAQEHVAAAIRLGPESAAASEVAGYVAGARGDVPTMLAAFAEAARRGSKDYRVYFEPAQRAQNEGNGVGGTLNLTPKEARRIANGYERAINVRPWALAAYQGLAGIIELVGPDNASDRKFLDLGHQQFPRDGMIQLGLATTAKQAGDPVEARRWLAGVWETAASHPPQVNAYAQRLDEGWTFEADTAKIGELVGAQRFREALAAMDALAAKGIPIGAKPTMALNRANCEASLNMEEARTAWDERRWADAKKFLEAILASPVQTGAKYEARRRLEDMKRLKLGQD